MQRWIYDNHLEKSACLKRLQPLFSNKSSIYYITGEQNASTRMEDNDLHAIYTTTISFDHTKFNTTIPLKDNQVTGNQDKVAISGKISNVGNCSGT